MGQREVIDQALAGLLEVLADRLAPAGWVVRLRGRELPGSGTLTRATQAGVMATAQLGRAEVRIPDDWPVHLRLLLGVGYEQALGLSVLLTTLPFVAVVPHPVTAEHGGMWLELSSEAGISALAEQIVALIDEHAVAFAERFPDVESLIAETGAGAGIDERGQPTGVAEPVRKPSVRDLTVLAAAGHHDQVTALLAEFEAARAGERTSHRRFIRQLHRWLDAGGPPVPPAEQTLARLPPRADQAGSSWSQARERFGSSRAAREAVQANARGKSADDLRDALQFEYTGRGLETRPSDLAGLAERLHAQQRPLGHARHRIHDLRKGVSAGLALVAFVRRGGHSKRLDRTLGKLSQLDPEWLRPPDRAGHPVAPRGTTETAAVVLDAGTDDLLAAVAAAAPRRIGDNVLVDVWFSQDNAPGDLPPVVTVHIGSHRVGTVAPDRAAPFGAIFRAAAFFDEDPLASGTLRRPGNRAWYLEFRLARTTEPSADPDDQPREFLQLDGN